MDNELAKELKDAGFPQKIDSNHHYRCGTCDTVPCVHWKAEPDPKHYYSIPTLEELIEACGFDFGSLRMIEAESSKRWEASGGPHGPHGERDARWGNSPSEAVARLWLALNKKV